MYVQYLCIYSVYYAHDTLELCLKDSIQDCNDSKHFYKRVNYTLKLSIGYYYIYNSIQ